MTDIHARTRQLIGAEGLDRLISAKVAVIGLGGVGGNAAETLLRSGIGSLHIYDGDTVEISNINRQLFATWDVAGRPKAMVAKERLLSIIPDAGVQAFDEFINDDNVDKVLDKGYTYIVDAIDNMRDKVRLIVCAHEAGTPIISATGAGNRLRADMLAVEDVFNTSGDPVCRILRRQLKEYGVGKHKVVYSREQPVTKAVPPASMAFVPNAMGVMLANHVVLDILKMSGGLE